MFRFPSFIATVSAVVLASSANSQNSYYVNFGAPAFSGTPSSDFAAAAPDAGSWNRIDVDFPSSVVTEPIMDTTGAMSGVTLTLEGSLFGLAADEVNTTGNDEVLLDNFYDPVGDSILRIDNLPAGTYDLYTYAMAPDDDSYRTSINVPGSPDPQQVVGGDFSAGYVLGVTHALHSVTITAGQPIIVDVDLVVMFASINGIQIVGEGSVMIGTSYCMANANSTGSAAEISATGSTMVGANDVTLAATSLPADSLALFLASQVQGFVPMNMGSAGNLCLGGDIGRYSGPGQVQSSGGNGEVLLSIDLTSVPQSTGQVSVVAGQSWNFQSWFRDSVGGVSSSNFTNGLEITFN